MAAVNLLREWRAGWRPERWRWWDPLDRLTLLVLRLEAGNVILGEKRRRRAERNSNVKSTNNAYDLRGTPRQGATERPRKGSTRSRPERAHGPQDGTGHRTRD
jgi:hypothetical protein